MCDEKTNDPIIVLSDPTVSAVDTYVPGRVSNGIPSDGRGARLRRAVVLLALVGSLLFLGLNHRREYSTVLSSSTRVFGDLGFKHNDLNATGTRPLLPSAEREELERYLTYAAAALCQRWRLEKWSCGSNCVGNVQVELIFDDKERGGYGYVGADHDRKEIIVAFKGSQSIMNWIMDLRYAKLDYDYPDAPGAAVHGGFYLTYRGVSSIILWQLQQMMTREENSCRGYTLVITGHSLGVALATLLTVDVKRYLLKPILEGRALGDPFTIKMTSMGQPRVGNDVFSKLIHDELTPHDGLNHSITRVTHASDWVPRLPMAKWGFIHHPHEVWVKDNEHSFLCQDEDLTEDILCINSNKLFNVFSHLFVWDVKFNGLC